MNIDELKKLAPEIIKKLFSGIIKIGEKINLPIKIQIAGYIVSNNKTNNLHIENFNCFESNKAETEKRVEKKVEEMIEKRREELELLPDDKQIQFLVSSSSNILHQSIANNQSTKKK